jgi:hypothetical protein
VAKVSLSRAFSVCSFLAWSILVLCLSLFAYIHVNTFGSSSEVLPCGDGCGVFLVDSCDETRTPFRNIMTL